MHESPLASLARSAKLKFPESREKLENEVDSPKSEVETFSETELVQPPTSLNQTQFAAATGEAQRASLNSMLLQRCGTKIELNTQSQLLLNAGQVATLLFEVTNMRAERVYQTVQVTDERRFLVQLSPTGWVSKETWGRNIFDANFFCLLQFLFACAGDEHRASDRACANGHLAWHHRQSHIH